MPPTKSRLNLARAAIRPAMFGKLMLSGPAGAGKTYTSLVIAETLAPVDGKILHIDTEKESALTYADLFTFEHLKWSAPFDPRDLQDTLLDAGGDYDVIIVDSFSHFWRGSGGILDIANGRFTGWKDARPAQVDVVEAILETDAHVIVCTRSKMDHVQQTAANGKQEVVKLGMAAIQDDDLEYEVNVSIEVDMQHVLQVGKSRTNAIPVGRTFAAGHAPEFAALYRDWLKAGEPVATSDQVQALIGTLNRIDQEAERVKAKQTFLERFGRPEFLLVSRLPEAGEWVADQVIAANGGPVSGNAVETDEPTDEATAPAQPLSGDLSALPADPAPEGPEPDQARDVNTGAERCDVCGVDPGELHDTAMHAAALPTDTNPEVEHAGDGTVHAAEADRVLAEAQAKRERVRKFTTAVGKKTTRQVTAALTGATLSTAGTPAERATRLVEHYVAQAEHADAFGDAQ